MILYADTLLRFPLYVKLPQPYMQFFVTILILDTDFLIV